MKKIFAGVVFGIFFVSLVSAGVVFEGTFNPVYNIGDKVNTAVRISPEPVFSEVASAYLECGSGSAEVYKEFLYLESESVKNIIIPLEKSLIGNLTGDCRINFYAGAVSQAVSDVFRVSNLVKVSLSGLENEFTPGDTIGISGSAIKENGESINGNYEANLNGTLIKGEIVNGEFTIPVYMESSFPAGQYMLEAGAYEKDGLGNVINSGKKIYFLKVKQVPTNVEIILENKSVLPGTKITGRIVLHDQTGISIKEVEVYIAIKDSYGNIIKKILAKTEENFEYGVLGSEPPAVFVVSAYSEGIIGNTKVTVLENKNINVEIVNNTLILTNTGNVFYNDTLIVKIGEDNVEILLSMDVGEEEKYIISAPDGHYDVSVGGVEKTLFLSGNAVDVRKLGVGSSGVSPAVWIGLIIFLFAGAYIAFRRERKKRSFARMKKVPNIPRSELSSVSAVKSTAKALKSSSVANQVKEPVRNNSGVNLLNNKSVEISLSIEGSKQNASLGCISIKNYPEIKSGDGNVKETLDKIEEIVEGSKGFIYSNASYIFFIFAPAFTKTFRNHEGVAMISQKIKENLLTHNKKFKKKIDFGISLNYGSIVIRVEGGKTKFMSLGTLMTSAKKLANYSTGDVILSEKFRENLGNLKGEPFSVGGVKAYKLEGMANRNKHSAFIKGFLARQEKERAKEMEAKAKAKETKAEKEESSVNDHFIDNLDE